MTATVVDRGTPVVTGDEHRRRAALLERAGEGDQTAFMELYDLTSTHVYRLLLCRLGDAAAAERATCTLYVEAWVRAAEHARSGLSALAWLVSLAPRTQDGSPGSGLLRR